MKIVIASIGTIPVTLYGGTERVIWCLGKELVKIGHKVTYLVKKGSFCNFAPVIWLDESTEINEQIPDDTDVVHFNFQPKNIDQVTKPYVITMHGNSNDDTLFDQNTIFVSKNHASRYGSASYVHNGLDWQDYMPPDFSGQKKYFHFLGNAAWRAKNVQGAIDVIKKTKKEQLKVLGGVRFNFKMGMRFTFSPRVTFCGMVGSPKKDMLLNGSKGLIFPVKWHEPFGLAIIESLYYGCPVFGTPYGSLPELLINDVGFLSADLNSLANAVENSDSYSRKTCHEYAVEEFNSKNMALGYIEKYEKALNNELLNEKCPKLKEKQKGKYLDWLS